MGIEKKPKSLARIQALASNGQCQLISLWVSLFGHLRQEVNQILLTRNDIADRTQYLNAQNTFAEAFNMGMIPIVNENDTIAVSEIRAIDKFGDNDTLSAITAAMVQADYLFLMTDVDCLYDKNPRIHADAKAIEVVEDISSLEADVSSSGSALGTGGMSTKIVAAKLATSAGVTTVITRASNPGNILNIVRYLQALRQQKRLSAPPSQPGTPAASTDDERDGILTNSTSSLSQSNASLPKGPPIHTRFLPSSQPTRDRSFWLLHGLAPHGTIFIDEGAHRALSRKAGLLPAGILDVEGPFAQQEAVRLVVMQREPSNSISTHTTTSPPGLADNATVRIATSTTDTNGISREVIDTDDQKNDLSMEPGIHFTPIEIGRALVNYSATEIARIKGCNSKEIEQLLGYADSEYVALRENVSLFRKEKGSRPATPGPPTGRSEGSVMLETECEKAILNAG